MTDRPKIFISYSWSPMTNKIWTLDFAERLTRDGIHVIIDEWDAEEGQDKFHFMEQMVNNPEVKHVLLICNKDYSEKANSKKGGVGIESQIVSSEIYNQVDQNKFIPIVREYKDSKACLPTFVSSRFYIDLSDSEYFEENYEQLIRRVFGKPKHKRPPIGEAPSYISEDEPTYLNTAHKFRPLKDSLLNGKANANGHLLDYFDLFNQTLVDFKVASNIDPNNPPIDEEIITKFEQLKALRDEFIEIISLYVKYSEVDNEWLFKMVESAYNSVNSSVNDSYYDYNNHLQLFLNEMFLYLTSILLKHERFDTISYLLKNKYCIEHEHREITFESYCWNFNQHNRIIDEIRNKRLQLHRISLSSDLIKERATNKLIKFEDIHDMDILLHYSGLLLHNDSWFPRLSIYGRGSGRPKLIQRMKSKRYFDKVKPMFGVKTKDELFKKISGLDKNIYNGYHPYNYRFSGIFNAFKSDEICSIE